MHLLPCVAIQPNLELRTRPKPVLSSLPLAFALPGLAAWKSAQISAHVWPQNGKIFFCQIAAFCCQIEGQIFDGFLFCLLMPKMHLGSIRIWPKPGHKKLPKLPPKRKILNSKSTDFGRFSSCPMTTHIFIFINIWIVYYSLPPKSNVICSGTLVVLLLYQWSQCLWWMLCHCCDCLPC